MKTFFTIILLLFCATINAQTIGLISNMVGNSDGYVLFAPITSDNTYLIDKCGKEIHSWTSTYRPGQSVYLLNDGTLLRTGNANNTTFTSGGKGGIIEMSDWNNNIFWSYTISSNTECQHHDVCHLPNGNILAIVWELKTAAEALAAGRDPLQTGISLWSEKIVELESVGSNSANIVWEWHIWDHLIQDFDISKSNYGVVADHAELLNINYITGNATASDWLHVNSISYNPLLDQVMISSHNLSEIWIIDHSTTTVEAQSHTGGLRNHGGDILYRWGNPEVYGSGTVADKKFYGQHNAQWIDTGMVNANDILVFNNGLQRPMGNFSSVEIIHPPIDSAGNYIYTPGHSFLPDTAVWMYTDSVPTDFYASNISGAQRLSNGNTLICNGPAGTFFEIDSTRTTVWKYINPVATNILTQGTTPSMNSVFRCTLYPPDYAAFNGHSLLPGTPIEINPLPYNCLATGITSTEENYIYLKLTDELSIHSSVNEEVNIRLYTSDGRLTAEWNTILSGETTLPCQSLSKGIYIISIAGKKIHQTFKAANL
jgi:hypothetical protein